MHNLKPLLCIFIKPPIIELVGDLFFILKAMLRSESSSFNSIDYW